MKEIKIFMAEDGKMLETMRDCMDYEESIPTEDKLVELTSYSIRDNCVTLNNLQDVREFLKEGQVWLETLAGDVWNGF